MVPLIEGGFGGADCLCDGELGTEGLGSDDGEAGSESAVIEPCAKQGGTQADGSDAISVGLGDALDEPVPAQATQVVGHSAGGILARFVPEQGSEMLADVIVSERALDEDEEEQDVEQGLNARVGEAQGGSAVAVDDDGSLHLLESGFADKTIMTELDFGQF